MIPNEHQIRQHLLQALDLLDLEDQEIQPTAKGWQIVGPRFREEVFDVRPPWHLDINVGFPAGWGPPIDRDRKPQIPLVHIYSLSDDLIFGITYRALSRRLFFDFGDFGQVRSNIQFASLEVEGGTLNVAADLPGRLLEVSGGGRQEELRAGWSGVHTLPPTPAKLHLGMKRPKGSWVPPNGLTVSLDLVGKAAG